MRGSKGKPATDQRCYSILNYGDGIEVDEYLALAIMSRKLKGYRSKAWDSAKLGYKLGLGIGGIGSLGAYIVGISLVKRRSNKEHAEYLNSSALPNYIILYQVSLATIEVDDRL